MQNPIVIFAAHQCTRMTSAVSSSRNCCMMKSCHSAPHLSLKNGVPTLSWKVTSSVDLYDYRTQLSDGYRQKTRVISLSECSVDLTRPIDTLTRSRVLSLLWRCFFGRFHFTLSLFDALFPSHLFFFFEKLRSWEQPFFFFLIVFSCNLFRSVTCKTMHLVRHSNIDTSIQGSEARGVNR